MNITLKCMYCFIDFKQAFDPVDRQKNHTDTAGIEDTK